MISKEGWIITVKRELRPCWWYSGDRKRREKVLYHGVFGNQAVVEFEDGTFMQTGFSQIQFVDSSCKFNEIVWPEEENHE